jgi:hypothetical protein
MEKPKLLECPKDVTIISAKDKERVSWDDPKFQDNYDPQPRIASNQLTGTFFYYGKTKITYTATDKSGNVATCQFNVIISGIITLMTTEKKTQGHKRRHKRNSSLD